MSKNDNIDIYVTEYNETSGKRAIWHGDITKGFSKWLKKEKNLSDEEINDISEFTLDLSSSDKKEMKEAIEQVNEYLDKNDDKNDEKNNEKNNEKKILKPIIKKKPTKNNEKKILKPIIKKKSTKNNTNAFVNETKQETTKTTENTKPKILLKKKDNTKQETTKTTENTKPKILLKKKDNTKQETTKTTENTKPKIITLKPKIIKPTISKRIPNNNSIAKIFKQTNADIWIKVAEKQKELLGLKRSKGFLIVNSGDTKTGKTRFGLSACQFNGLSDGKFRTIPKGYPTYVIAFDDDPLDEVERSFPNEFLNGKILHMNCYVENKETGLIDPIASLEKANEYIFALTNVKDGTLFIDDYTFYCMLVLFSFLQTSAKVKDNTTGKQRSIRFDEFLRPDKKIMPFEYQYKNRAMMFILRKLKQFTINIVFGVQLKPEYMNDDKSGFAKLTGAMLEDFQKGTDQWVDIIARLTKQKEGGILKRKMIITKSRFEGKDVILKNVTLDAPDLKDLMVKIIKEYL